MSYRNRVCVYVVCVCVCRFICVFCILRILICYLHILAYSRYSTYPYLAYSRYCTYFAYFTYCEYIFQHYQEPILPVIATPSVLDEGSKPHPSCHHCPFQCPATASCSNVQYQDNTVQDAKRIRRLSRCFLRENKNLNCKDRCRRWYVSAGPWKRVPSIPQVCN